MSINERGMATDLLVEAARAAAPALRVAEGVQIVWNVAVQPSTATWKRAALVAAMTSVPHVLGGPLGFVARYLVLFSVFRGMEAYAPACLVIRTREGGIVSPPAGPRRRAKQADEGAK